MVILSIEQLENIIRMATHWPSPVVQSWVKDLPEVRLAKVNADLADALGRAVREQGTDDARREVTHLLKAKQEILDLMIEAQGADPYS